MYTQDERPCIQHNIPGLFFAKQVITNACATQVRGAISLFLLDVLIGGWNLCATRCGLGFRVLSEGGEWWGEW